MYKKYRLISKNGKVRIVTEFPWVAPAPCPWDNERFARVMIPFSESEQAKHKHPQQHIQIVRRNRLSIIRPSIVKAA